MSEVGALIINLQLQTAKFREDMGKVKSDLDGLKDKIGSTSDGASSGFEKMGAGTGGLRSQIGLLDNSIRGAHAQAMADLIRRYSDTAIVMKLLPIAATGAAFLVMGELAYQGVEKIVTAIREARAEMEKLHETEENVAGTIGSVGTGLRDKLLEAGIEADNLAGNHLAAVKKELELIDDQSMSELAQTFNVLAQAADKAFDQIKTHWWEFSSGSAGAKHSLEQFQAQYEMLLKTGKTDAANKLLDDKVAREKEILALQRERADSQGDEAGNYARDLAAKQKLVALTGENLDFSDKAIQSESMLLDILQAQVDARQTIATTGGVKKHNAVEKADQAGDKDALKALEREAAFQKIAAQGVEQHQQALIHLARTKAETAIASTRGGEDDTDDGKLAAQKAAIEAQRDDSIAAAKVELDAKQGVYNADLKAAGNNAAKKRELAAQYANDVRAYNDSVVQYNADAQRQIVAATREAANQKAAAERAAAQQGYDDTLKAAISAAQRTEKMQEEAAKNLQALHQKTDAQTLAAQITAVQGETKVEAAAYNDRIKNLDKFSTDYQKRVKELQDHIKQIEQQGDDQVTKLKQDAAQKQAMEIITAENRMRDAIASDMAHSIVMNKSLAQAFRQTGEEMAEQAIKNLIVMEMTGDKSKLIAAKKAYHEAFAANAGIPPAPMWGYAAGAAAFAGVMAFDTGGVIPGEGAVPIIGHGGEEVITKQLKERVERSEMWGNNDGGNTHNYHYSPTVHAMDADGVDRVLSKHNSVFQRHVASTLRRMNK